MKHKVFSIGIGMFLFLFFEVISLKKYDFSFMRMIIVDPIEPQATSFLLTFDSLDFISHGKMHTSCRDMRFYHKSVPLKHWIEFGCHTKHTNVWVEKPSSVSSMESYNVMWVYGNKEAPSDSLNWQGLFYMLGDDNTVIDPLSFQFSRVSISSGVNDLFLKPSATPNKFSNNNHDHICSGYTSLTIETRTQSQIYNSGTQCVCNLDHKHSYSFNLDESNVNIVPEYVKLSLHVATEGFHKFPQGLLTVFIQSPETVSSNWIPLDKYANKYIRITAHGHEVGDEGNGMRIHDHMKTGTELTAQSEISFCECGASGGTVPDVHYHTINPFVTFPRDASDPTHVNVILGVNTNGHDSVPVENLIMFTNSPVLPPFGYRRVEELYQDDVVFRINYNVNDVLKYVKPTHNHSYTFSTSFFTSLIDAGSFPDSVPALTHSHQAYRRDSKESSYIPLTYSLTPIVRISSYVDVGVGDEIQLFWKCFGVDSENENVCNSQKGVCYAEDLCNCTVPYYSDECLELISSAKFIKNRILTIKYVTKVEYLVPLELDSNNEFECSKMFPNSQSFQHLFPVCSFETEMYSTTQVKVVFSSDLPINLHKITIYNLFNYMDTTKTTVLLDIEQCTGVGDFCSSDDLPTITDDTLELVLWIVLPVVSVFFIVLIIVVLCLIVILLFIFNKVKKQGKELGRFKKIEDIDILLQEQEIDKKSSQPKLKFNKNFFKIQFESIKLIEKIGGSEFDGIVTYKVNWESKNCSLKVFSLSGSTDNTNTIDIFQRQVNIIANLAHPNISKFYGACIDGNNSKIGILLQLCENGTIKQYFQNEKNTKSITNDVKLNGIKDVATAMYYLHDRTIIHRNLNHNTVLVNSDLSFILSDFGVARTIDSSSNNELTKRVGKMSTMAPEVFLGMEYNVQADVFCFGVLMFEIMTNIFDPFLKISPNLNLDAVVWRISSDPNFRPSLNELRKKNVEPWIISLVNSCWDYNSKVRPTFEQILRILKKKKSSVNDVVIQKISKEEEVELLKSQIEDLEKFYGEKIKNQKVEIGKLGKEEK